MYPCLFGLLLQEGLKEKSGFEELEQLMQFLELNNMPRARIQDRK
jgi:hypothetical protein